MADISESLESIVRRTRSYIQLLKQENSDLLEWQQETLPFLQQAVDQLRADGHRDLAEQLNFLIVKATI